MKKLQEIKNAGCVLLIIIICASIGSIIANILWLEENSRNLTPTYQDSLNIKNTKIYDPNKRLKNAANNPNSTDPARGLTNSVWGDN